MPKTEEITENQIKCFRRCVNNNVEYWNNYNLYGPANPKKISTINPDIIYKCNSTPTGVCHMLTCKCLIENGDDIKSDDWFTGFCLECDIKIEKKEKAWRSPNLNGSFHDDCYCSYEHMELQFLDEEDEESISLLKVIKSVRDKFPIRTFSKDLFIDDVEKNNFDI